MPNRRRKPRSRNPRRAPVRNSQGIVNYIPPRVNPNSFLTTTITQNQTVTGSSPGAALAAVIDVTRSSFPELNGNFLGLFTYAKILGGRLWYKFSVGVSGSNSTSTCGAAVGFDTHISGSGLTVPVLMAETYHSKPKQIYLDTSIPTVSTSSFECLSYKCPVRSIPINAGDPIAGSWFLIDAGSTPTFHNVQFCCDASGGSGVVNVTWFLELDVMFATRI